jgi:hypothetical protein
VEKKMATAVNEFFLSLASAIAAATGLALEGTPRALWINSATESPGLNAATYTVLRIYGGSEPATFAGMRFPSVRVQADTRGTDGALAMVQAWTHL